MVVIKGNVWAANRTGVRLGMKPAICRIIIFFPALPTHCKMFHRGVWPVIGDIVYDRITRAAVGTVDEGILVATVVRIKQLSKTIVAYSHIRRNQGLLRGLALAALNGKFLIPSGRFVRACNLSDVCKRRGIFGKIPDKGLNLYFSSLNMDRYP